MSFRFPTGAIDIGQPVNRGCGLNYGLVSWWLTYHNPFSGGTTFRDLAGTNHGTLTNGPTWGGALGRPGGFGAITFDGIDDYVNVGDVQDCSAITITAWVRPSSVSLYGSIFTKRNGGTNATAWGFDRALNNGRLRFYVNNGGFSIWETSSTSLLSVGVHCYVAVTYDAVNDAALYADGVSVSSTRTVGSISAILNNDVPAYIGWFESAVGADTPWAGLLDDVRLYNRALSASEVFALYTDSLCGYPLTLNRLRRATVFDVGGGGGGGFVPYPRPRGLEAGMFGMSGGLA